jgi:hypothetical protein
VFGAHSSVHEVYHRLGNSYFQRAYRMSYESFWNLHTKLAARINRARLAMRRYDVPKGLRKGGKYKLPPIRNGRVTTSVCLACALRYFGRSSVYDLMGTYGISHTDIMDSVWHVVEAVIIVRGVIGSHHGKSLCSLLIEVKIIMSTLNNDGINLSITTPHHRIGAVGVGVADVQPPPVQHRHIVIVVSPPPPRVPLPLATPGRDRAGGSAKEEKGQ